MRFELKAMTPAGRVESLALDAADEGAARAQVTGRGYVVLRVQAQARLALFRSRREVFPVVQFTQELIALLDGGLPLVEAVETLGEKQEAASAKEVLARVAELLREGRPLSAALAEFPAVFSPLYVATV